MLLRAALVAAFLCATAIAQISITGVTSAAGFKPGITEYGGLNSLFCTGLVGIEGILTPSGYPLPRTLAGVQVFINNEPAPLTAIANAGAYYQINFQNIGMAFTPPGSNPDVIRVVQTRFGIPSTSDPFSPPQSKGVFFENADGYAIVQRASDNVLIDASNPARPGDVLVVYATGLGSTTPDIKPGEPAPFDPLSRLPQMSELDSHSLTVGDQPAQLFYAGLTPGFAGLYQINFRVPESLSSGDFDLIFERRRCAAPFGERCGGLFPFDTFVSAPSKLLVRTP
jgi:uncharacterized protein (TIGR03437 family)